MSFASSAGGRASLAGGGFRPAYRPIGVRQIVGLLLLGILSPYLLTVEARLVRPGGAGLGGVAAHAIGWIRGDLMPSSAAAGVAARAEGALLPADREPAAPPPAQLRDCGVTPLLVPSCGAWLGVAPGSFTDQPKPEALASFEAATGAPTDIVHVYHRAGELFPNTDDLAMTRQGGVHRLLMVNYKPEAGHTWAEVAAGAMDRELDREAAYLRGHYRDRFFFTVHHEPENEVRAAAGSGFTAADYAAMYRHVVQRLRADGVTNLVTVLNYMGFRRWLAQPWFADLYPGDDVVDWIAWDPYACLDGRSCGDFGDLLGLTSAPGRPGFYRWVTRTHPGKPLMLAEWGASDPRDPALKAAFFRSVAAELPKVPALKALIYFDSPVFRVNSSVGSAAEFRAMVRDRYFAQQPG